MPALAQEHLDYRSYMGRDFPAQLAEVARAARRPNRRTWAERDGGIVLSVLDLGLTNAAVRRMPEFERDLFSVTLAWTVCLDEGMWSWGRHEYDRFRPLTRFPKLLGTQPLHAHPLQALRMLGGATADWMHVRMSRYALLNALSPAVEDVITRIAVMQEMPVLREVFARSCDELRVRPMVMVDAVADPMPIDRIVDWRMPVMPPPEDDPYLMRRQRTVTPTPEH